MKGRAARHEPQDFAEWAKDLSTETADNMRWYNDYAPIHEARYPGTPPFSSNDDIDNEADDYHNKKQQHRHAEITAKVYPAMATFEAWLAESSWLAQ